MKIQLCRTLSSFFELFRGFPSRHFTLLILCYCISLGTAHAQTTVVIQEGDALTDQYCMGLVQLILNQEAGYRVEITADNDSTLARRIENLNKGILSIIWTGTSNELEETLRPIRIPVLKGLMGHRVLLIREVDQRRFDTIESLDDLKKMTLGQGTHWVDTGILEANGLNLVKNPHYLNLFFMLDGGRFDAFPRGIHEIWSEVERQRRENGHLLVAEKNLMLVYRMPLYFFVRKDNEKLANDLETGMLKAIENGTFDAYFFNNPGVREFLQKAGLKNRRVFRLDNPSLPPRTPLDKEAFWLDIESLPHEE